MQNRFIYNEDFFSTTDSAGSAGEDAFKEFDATELYCPKCKRAVPVRKRLLLVLPQGDKYEYLCAFCSTSVGTKLARQTDQMQILV